MIIKECKFEPILIDSRCFRKGILITLTNQYGKTTTTEVSPLPGFSRETHEEALHQLQKLKQRLLTTWWTKQALYYLNNLGLFPSVYFGIESALLDLLDPLPEPTPSKTYALLFGSPEEIFFRSQEVYDEGFRHAKVKLGHFTPQTAHKIIEKLGECFRLRLDLNRKWPIEETLAFCKAYPDDFFEYIEEPSKDPKKLVDFPYPFALDESLRDCPLVKCANLKALVIKPTMLYPFSPFLKLGFQVVLTSSFESPVGIAQIRRLITRLNLNDTHHGLDTLRYFENIYDTLPDCPLETALS